jgi:hypothetical protein
MALLWVLNLSDGKHTLFDIAERAKLPFSTILGAANALESAALLRPLGNASDVAAASTIGALDSTTTQRR